MSTENKHYIAFGQGNMGHIECHSLSDYDRLTQGKDLRAMIAKIRRGDDALKKQLPFRAAHYARFRDNHRSAKDAEQDSFLFQTTVDVDDIRYVGTAVSKALSLNAAPGIWRGKLLHLEHSARRKLHIDIRLPMGYTIEEAQEEYCRILGIPFDKSCVTPERIIYITTDRDEIYRAEGWYQILPDDELRAYRKAYADRGLTSDGRHIAGGAPAAPKAADNSGAHAAPQADDDKDLGRCVQIFDLAMQDKGITPQTLNIAGSRHNTLCSVLSTGICRLMSMDRMLKVVALRMPGFARESDCRQLVSDFYNNYTQMNRPMSVRLSSILSQTLAAENNEEGRREEIWSVADEYNQRLAEVDLPVGIKESLKAVGPNTKMCALAAILPIAGALADGVTAEYCDGTQQHMNLMSVIVGQQASGKSICKKIVDKWTRKILESDERERAREQLWKEQNKRRKANEKGAEDPHALIRYVPMTISCSTLLKRFKNSQGHCLYSFSEELDTLLKTNGAGAWSQKYDIYRLGFDRGLWGQDYNSDNAESGIVEVNYNFTALGTYGSLNKCLNSSNIENGLSSRIIVAEMPDNTFGRMPHYEKLTDQEEANIQKAVDTLCQARGEIEAGKLRAIIDNWEETKRLQAARSLDYSMDVYRKRAGVIAFRAGIIFHLLSHDNDVSDNTVKFALLVADYVLEEQMSLFGSSFNNARNSASETVRLKSKNRVLFENLPHRFTQEDYLALSGSSTTRNSIYIAIHRWMTAGIIRKVGSKCWEKV